MQSVKVFYYVILVYISEQQNQHFCQKKT